MLQQNERLYITQVRAYVTQRRQPAAAGLDKYPLPLPPLDEIPRTLTAIQRHIQSNVTFIPRKIIWNN